MKKTKKNKAGPAATGPTRKRQTKSTDGKPDTTIVPRMPNKSKKDSVEVITPLSSGEKAKLKTCEDVIRTAIKSAVVMSKALRTIQEEKLYREKYDSFEKYLADVHKMSRSYAYDLINYDTVRGNLSAMADTIVLPSNERQARPLSQLEPKRQAKAWEKAVKMAGEEPVTESHVKSAVQKLLGKKKPATAPAKNPESVLGDDSDQWVNSRVSALLSDDCVSLFDEPLPWGDVLADLHIVSKNTYLKFIDDVEVPSALYAIALKAALPNSICIVNGEANQCTDVKPGKNGQMKGLFCPHLNYFAKQAGINVEYKGKLYTSVPSGSKGELTWKPVTDKTIKGIFKTYTENLAAA